MKLSRRKKSKLMKISRERFEQASRDLLTAVDEREQALRDLLTAVDERDELLSLCLDYINAHTKDEPLTWKIAYYLRGTKWESKPGS